MICCCIMLSHACSSYTVNTPVVPVISAKHINIPFVISFFVTHNYINDNCDNDFVVGNMLMINQQLLLLSISDAAAREGHNMTFLWNTIPNNMQTNVPPGQIMQ